MQPRIKLLALLGKLVLLQPKRSLALSDIGVTLCVVLCLFLR